MGQKSKSRGSKNTLEKLNAIVNATLDKVKPDFFSLVIMLCLTQNMTFIIWKLMNLIT